MARRITGAITSLAAGVMLVVHVWCAAKADQVQAQSRDVYSFGATNNGLALSANLVERQAASAGAPIAITFVVKNFGAPISIFRLGSIKEYYLTGTGPDGSPIKKLNPNVGFSGSVRSGWQLGSGATYQHTTDDLGQFYDFHMPGRYMFEFQTAIHLQFKLDQTYASLKSNTLTLDVK